MTPAVDGFDGAARHDRTLADVALGAHVSTPVLIVGAGPVGLLSAILLAQHGIAATVIERHPGTSIHPKARGVSPRSMEIFRQVGIADELVTRSLAIAGETAHMCLCPTTLAAPEYRRIPLGNANAEIERISPHRSTLAAQDAIEALLVDAARRRDQLDVHFATELVDFSQSDAEVVANVRHRKSGKETVITAKYLIAADGSRSTVRELLGIATSGERDLAENINVLFDADLKQLVEHRLSVLYNVMGSAAPGVFLTVDNDRRWLYNFDLMGEAAADYDNARLTARICQAIGHEVALSVVSAVHWTTNAVVADRFTAGRVFLAGDSAHVTPPNGAFGMNIGVQDAHNLAWKVAAVLTDTAGPALLDTYDTERRPIAQQTVNQALENLKSMRLGPRIGGQPGSPPTSLRLGNPGDDHAGRLLLGYRYTSAAILEPTDVEVDVEVGDDVEMRARPFGLGDYTPGAAPGERAPHAWVRRQSDRLSMIDLYTQGFTLVIGPDADGELSGTANLQVIRVGTDVVAIDNHAIESDEVIDGTNALLVLYGISAKGMVLVRPDGFVAWRSRDGVEADPRAALQRVLASGQIRPVS
jgi:putative polyketide hydroxylase